MARDVGVDDKTIFSYFSILEDTLIGFFLPSFHRSIRKQQREAPKFYFFDTGITRALSDTLRVELLPQTFAFGNAFEHWIVLECFRLNEYHKLYNKFFYLKTKDCAEIDLIVQRPGKGELLIEIKSTDHVTPDHVSKMKPFQKDWGAPCEAQVWSLDLMEKEIEGVRCIPWTLGLQEFLGG